MSSVTSLLYYKYIPYLPLFPFPFLRLRFSSCTVHFANWDDRLLYFSLHQCFLHQFPPFFFFSFFTKLSRGILFFLFNFIYLCMAVLRLRFCARAFSSCGKWGPLFIAACGPLTIAASLVAELRLQTRRLSNCGSRA